MEIYKRVDAKVMLLILTFIFLVWNAACQANGGITMKAEILEGGYSIRVPACLVTTYSSPVEDFVLYSLNDAKSEKLLLTIYIGNNPAPAERNITYIEKFSKLIGGFVATFAKLPCNNDQHCGEVRIQLLNDGGWPAFAHLFYKNISQSELAMIEEIIESFNKERSRE